MAIQIPSTQPNSSRRPPGAVSYNVTLHQHQAPPGANEGEAGDNILANKHGEKQKSELKERSQNKAHDNYESSKFPYNVYQMSGGDKSMNVTEKSAVFFLHEFDRLDTLLNLSLIYRKRALDISRYLIDIGKATIETGTRMIQVHIKSETQSERDRNAVKIGRRLIFAGERILSRGEKVLKAVTSSKRKKTTTTEKTKIPSSKLSDLQVVTPIIKMISLCSHGPSYDGVTLLGGIRAGHFVGHGKVDNMQACIKKCCANQECDLAFMVKEDCYSVICYHKKLCRSVRAKHAKKYQPRIVRIWRGSSKKRDKVTYRHKSLPRGNLIKNAQNRESFSGPARTNQTLQKQQKQKMTLLNHRENESVTGATATLQSNLSSHSVAESAGKNKPPETHKQKQSALKKHSLKVFSSSYASRYAKTFLGDKASLSVKQTSRKSAKLKKKTTGTVNLSKSPIKIYKAKPAVHIHPDLHNSQSACPHSHVDYNVGLKHGLKTGHFVYIGELLDLKACLKICCHDPVCDIAFMLDQSCYTVNCGNESVCKSVPYYQHKFSTKAVFVTRRFNKRLSENVTTRNSLNSTQVSSKDVSTEKLIMSSSVTIPTKPDFSYHTSTSKTSRTSSLQRGVATTSVTPQEEYIDQKHLKNQGVSTAEENFLNTDISPMKTMKSHASESVELNSLQPGENENIKIDFNERSELTPRKTYFVKNKSKNEDLQEINVTIQLPNYHNIKGESTNLLLAQSETHSGKDLHSLKEKESTGSKHEGQDGQIKEYLPSVLNATLHLNQLDHNSFPQGEPDYYYESLPSDGGSVENSGSSEGIKEQSVSSHLDTSSSTTFASGVDITYPDSNEGVEDLSPSRSDIPLTSRDCFSTETYHNVTLCGGLKAGRFTFAGIVSSQQDCVTSCCIAKGCDLSFTVLDRCFLVDCYDADLCDFIAARNVDKFRPVITYINLTLIDTLKAKSLRNSLVQNWPSKTEVSRTNINQPYNQEEERIGIPDTLVERKNKTMSGNTYLKDNRNASLPTALNQSKCSFGATFHNVSFRLGRQAGTFINLGVTDDIHECAYLCCETLNCDVAFMISQDCFSVHCRSNETCKTFAVYGSKFKPRLVFVQRSGVKKESVTKSRHLPKTSLVALSTSQWNKFALSAAASQAPTESRNFVMSSADVLSTVSSVASNVFPTDAPDTSLQNDTAKLDTSPPSDTLPLDFVEVKTNGSEFWWQYYNPTDKNLTTSRFEKVYPDISVDNSSLANSLVNDASFPSSSSPDESPVKNVKSFIAKIDPKEDTLPEKTQAEEDNSLTEANFIITSLNISTLTNSASSPVVHVSNSQISSFQVVLPIFSSQTYPFASKDVGKRPPLEQFGKDRSLCNSTTVLTGVTLKGGYYAGIFSRLDNATSMKECVSECCNMPGCNIAFMVAKVCYAVQCFSDKKCLSVRAHSANKYHPRMARIRHFDSASSDAFKGVNSDRLRCVLDDIIDSKYKVQDGSIFAHSSSHDLGDCAKLCCQTSGCEVAMQDNDKCYSLNCFGNNKCPEMLLTNSSQSVAVVKDLINPDNISEHSFSKACDFSPALHDVVLRGGSHSGKFKYLIAVADMATCIQECCRHKVCDVALMLKDNCFLVSCHNEKLCDAIPSHPSEYHPQIAYKIKHGSRRHIGKKTTLTLTFSLLKGSRHHS